MPGQPGKNCKSPFRQERKPSFSVYRASDGHERWFDQSTHQGGDVIDFLKVARDIATQGDAMRELEAIVNIARPTAPAPVSYSVSAVLKYPEGFTAPTDAQCFDLAILRGLSMSTFSLAGLLGTLTVGKDPVRGQELWWITDKARKGLEGRTLDGELCRASGKKCFAYPGTAKSWLYGLQTNNPHYDALDRVLIVEGGPDYFAGLQLAIESDINFRVATMLGSGARIGEEALTALRGKVVIVVPHADPSGSIALERWRAALSNIVNRVVVQDLPQGVKDLNDLLLDSVEEDRLKLLKGFE